MLKKYVHCRVRIDALHCWENADSTVNYLSHKHRHNFDIRLKFPVTNNDREIEFIQMETRVRGYLATNYWNDAFSIVDFGGRSCEDIAQELIEIFGACACSVFEDEDGGAEIISH